MSVRLFLDILKTMQFGKLYLLSQCVSPASTFDTSLKIGHRYGRIMAEWAAEEIFLLFAKIPKVLQSEQVGKNDYRICYS